MAQSVALAVVMAGREFSPESELSDVAWLSGRSGPPVADIAPHGFDAYVRVCHPAEKDDRRYLWEGVAQEMGSTAHPLMPWHALVGASDYLNKSDSQWPGFDPNVGRLDVEILQAVCDVLSRHTLSAESCSLGVWEGYGFIDAGPTIWFSQIGSGVGTRPAAFSRERPRFSWWGRAYYVFGGPLTAAVEMTDRWGQSPNVIWPEDHAFFLGTEIDFDSTLIAGSEALAQDLLNSPEIDAWRVTPDASFTASADKINAEN